MSREDGDRYEQIAEHICRAFGYQVILPTVGNQQSWDMKVNGMRLQVKKRCVDASKPNNIRLVTSKSSSEPVYHTDDVDVFAIHWSDAWFVFASSSIADASGVIRNGVYMPSLVAFRNRWGVLDGEHVDMHVQGVLF